MRCPECDAFVKASAEECPNCGHSMSKTAKGKGPKDKGGRKKGTKGAKGKIIDRRGEEEEFLSSASERRGEEEEEERKIKEKATLGAVFLFVAGLDAIITGISNLFMISGTMMEDFLRFWNVSDEDISEYLGFAKATFYTCNVVMIIAGLLLLVAAFLAYKRKNWPACVILSIIGVFSGGFVFTATIAAAIGLRFIFISRRQFEDFKEMENK